MPPTPNDWRNRRSAWAGRGTRAEAASREGGNGGSGSGRPGVQGPRCVGPRRGSGLVRPVEKGEIQARRGPRDRGDVGPLCFAKGGRGSRRPGRRGDGPKQDPCSRRKEPGCPPGGDKTFFLPAERTRRFASEIPTFFLPAERTRRFAGREPDFLPPSGKNPAVRRARTGLSSSQRKEPRGSRGGDPTFFLPDPARRGPEVSTSGSIATPVLDPGPYGGRLRPLGVRGALGPLATNGQGGVAWFARLRKGGTSRGTVIWTRQHHRGHRPWMCRRPGRPKRPVYGRTSCSVWRGLGPRSGRRPNILFGLEGSRASKWL